MAIRLDHTIVPSRDKDASAKFFAEIFGLKVSRGFFALVPYRVRSPQPDVRFESLADIEIVGQGCPLHPQKPTFVVPEGSSLRLSNATTNRSLHPLGIATRWARC